MRIFAIALLCILLVSGCAAVQKGMDFLVGTDTDVPTEETAAGRGAKMLPYGLAAPALLLLEWYRRRRKARKAVDAATVIVN